MSRRRRARNIDYLKGIHYPLQTYAWSGTQWTASTDFITNGKRPTDGSPMVITSQPPGASAKDDTSWQLTFGASHDCVLSLFNGAFLNDSIFKLGESLDNVYRQSMGTADDNIYEQSNSKQHIQYVVSKQTVSDARAALNFGTDIDDARGIAMRIPLMAAGWGRTVGMHPTDPNPSDANRRNNDDAHKFARETWKHGPIDLRWDKRRGVWAAWNDLIVDDRNENIGTMVFSTNPDSVCGFPYLRGKLEDVFRVRRTNRQSSVALNAAQTDEFAKTAEIVTTLNHQWFDPLRNTVDLMSNVFLIDLVDGGPSETCGNETTTLGKLEIFTTTFFHFNPSFHGPIAFTINDIRADELVGFMKFDGAAWVPVIEFDPCDQVGTELGILFENDQALETLLRSTRKKLDALVIPVITGAASTADANADSLKQGIQRALEETSDKTLASVNDGFTQLTADINSALADLASQIQACLIDLFGSDCPITPEEVLPPDLPIVNAGAVVGSVDVIVDTVLVGLNIFGFGLPPAIDIAEGDLIDDPCP